MAATAASEVTAILPGRDGGGDIFAVLVKRTYDMRADGLLERCEKARPFTAVDQYYDGGDAETSTVQHECDLVPFKAATDVVCVGSAWAPGGIAVTHMDVSLSVSGVTRTLRVIGDRRCLYRQGGLPLFTDPAPFVWMPIRYDNAYGGEDHFSNPELAFHYPRNFRGKGVVVRNIPEAVEGLPLPNLEDPADLLTPERLLIHDPDLWNDAPLPQGLGWFPKTFYPRCSFVGSIPGRMDPDTVMREERLGLVPQRQIARFRQRKLPSFDVRFNNGASPGLALPYLAGRETVLLQGLHPDGPLTLELPGDVPGMTLDIGAGETALDPVLQTVCIRMDDVQVDLVWAGAYAWAGIEAADQLTKMEAVVW